VLVRVPGRRIRPHPSCNENSGAEHGHELVADPLKAVVSCILTVRFVDLRAIEIKKDKCTESSSGLAAPELFASRSRSPILLGSGPSNYRFVSRVH